MAARLDVLTVLSHSRTRVAGRGVSVCVVWLCGRLLAVDHHLSYVHTISPPRPASPPAKLVVGRHATPRRRRREAGHHLTEPGRYDVGALRAGVVEHGGC